MGCEVKIEPTKAVASNMIVSTFSYNRELKFETYITNGMTYGIFYTTQQTSESGNGVAVVNLTKDALEIQKLTLEIKNLNK